MGLAFEATRVAPRLVAARAEPRWVPNRFAILKTEYDK